MLLSLSRIFRRYTDENLNLERGGRQLADHGRIDHLRLLRNRLIVEGWTSADRIGLRLNRTTLWVQPELATPGQNLRGFTLDIPFELGTPEILIRQGEAELRYPLAAFAAPWVALRRGLMIFPYVGTLISLLPQIRKWKLQGDLGAREVIKERLGLVPFSTARELEGAVLAPSAPLPPLPVTASVIVPIYNAFELLPEVLARAEANADQPIRMILIEDASPDPQVRPFVQAWAQDPARKWPVHLILNEKNLGFIASVNRGFGVARKWPEDPVVLLNSDAFLPQGWTSRLLAPLADPHVASVTPMSNDAEIFNLPVICARHDLKAGLGDRLDQAAQSLNAQASMADAPTGVGFCMAMSPKFLEQVPKFDTYFGRGYGEETDWCQRTRALGGRHIGLGTMFVEHRGGTSFGSKDKQALLQRNGAEIARRYPSYDREVQEFIRMDPLASTRLALALSWADLNQSDPVDLWLAHAMGGGAENDLRRRITATTQSGRSAVVLRVGQGHRWKIEVHSPHGVTQGLTNDEALMRKLLQRLGKRRVIYSCGVGERDPLALPELLLDLAGRGSDPLAGGPQALEVLGHDFFPISPSYTLLGSDRMYHGLPMQAEAAAADPAHSAERPGGIPVSLAEWQKAWGALFHHATGVTVFSENSRKIFSTVYPQVADRITVTPHELLTKVPSIPPARSPEGRPVIGILGNIGVQKGAAVLHELSKALAKDRQFDLVVIGHLDPAYALSPPSKVHGSYEWRDLPGLVARYGITAWMIPSIWPETFSFTTHEALATGMPVLTFDIGAQGDAVLQALAKGAKGAVLPLPHEVPLTAKTLRALLDQWS